MIRTTTLALLLSGALSVMANAQTADELKNDANTSGDVLVYGMGYAGHQYSPLTLVNKENVNKLVPIWGLALSDNHGGESFPVVKDGVIYATTHNATVAVDALTGKLIWRINHDYPPETLRAASLIAALRSTTARSSAPCLTIISSRSRVDAACR